MKGLLGLLVSVLFVGTAVASEPIGNEPGGALDTGKAVVNTLNPSGDVIIDCMHGGEIQVGTSVVAYSFKDWDNKIVNKLDARTGFFGVKGGYGTLSVALDRVTGIPVTKYIHAGWVGGYNGDRKTLVSGPVFGVKVEL
jgi:hypothetical protein